MSESSSPYNGRRKLFKTAGEERTGASDGASAGALVPVDVNGSPKVARGPDGRFLQGRWRPGESGNPLGISRSQSEAIRLAKAAAYELSEPIIRRLGEIALSAKPRDAMPAGVAVMAENTQEQSVPVRRGRGPGRPFPKGLSGNPGGRPRGVGYFRELARGHAADTIEVLARIAKDDKQPGRTRVAAGQVLLEYGLGKPMSVIENLDGDRLVVTVRTASGKDPWAKQTEPSLLPSGIP